MKYNTHRLNDVGLMLKSSVRVVREFNFLNHQHALWKRQRKLEVRRGVTDAEESRRTSVFFPRVDVSLVQATAAAGCSSRHATLFVKTDALGPIHRCTEGSSPPLAAAPVACCVVVFGEFQFGSVFLISHPTPRALGFMLVPASRYPSRRRRQWRTKE